MLRQVQEVFLSKSVLLLGTSSYLSRIEYHSLVFLPFAQSTQQEILLLLYSKSSGSLSSISSIIPGLLFSEVAPKNGERKSTISPTLSSLNPFPFKIGVKLNLTSPLHCYFSSCPEHSNANFIKY